MLELPAVDGLGLRRLAGAEQRLSQGLTGGEVPRGRLGVGQRVLQRDGNTLSAVVRNAWDCAPVLQSLTKNSIGKATGAFISIIGFTVLGLLGITWVPLALLIVLVVAMVFTAVYGWTVERVAYRPLRGSSRLAPLISAIGMSIFLQNYVQLAQGARVKPLQPVIQGGFIVRDVGEGYGDTAKIEKDVRVVTTITFYLTD